jgi:Spy/CpxP family protein refolding chaperone
VRRGWTFLLVLSLGMNAGLLIGALTGGDEEARPSTDRWERRGEAGLDPEGMVARRLGMLTRRCDLRPEQRGRMEEIVRGYAPRILERESRLRDAREDLLARLAEPVLDEEALRASRVELERAQAGLDSLVFESLLAEASVLEPEQRRLHLRLLSGRGPHRHRRGR